MPERTPRQLLAGAAACAAGFVALLILAYFVGPTRRLDAAALQGFEALQGQGINGLAAAASDLCDPFPYVLFVAAVVATALFTSGPKTAVAASILLVGANVSSQLLKPALAHHRDTSWQAIDTIHDAAYPSGHATAAMALSLAAVMVVAPRYRPLAAALGALFTIAVSFSVITLTWHFPSDVVGGYLLASGWCLVGLAALGTKEVRRTDIRPALAITAVTAAVVGAAALASDPAFVDRHTASVAVAAAIATAATALLAAYARNT
jgi:membrane-associated phospholipid phosphatase